MFDPFNQSVSTAELTSESIREDTCPKPTPLQDDCRGRIFVYDLETVPDESAHPRPDPKSVEPRSLNAEAVLKTADTVKAEIRIGITPEQAEQLLQMERNGKARKGVISELQKAVEESDRELAAWKMLATNPWACRIVALGLSWYGTGSVQSIVCTNEDEEREALLQFWNAASVGTRCGYCIHRFDDRVIVARSMLLGVLPPVGISLKKYDKRSIDLYQVLFDGAGDSAKLKDLVRRLGIEPPAGDTNGSHVLDMVDAGQWDVLNDYVCSDVTVEMELLQRLQKVVEL